MRRYFKYIFLSLATLAASCSDSFEDVESYDPATDGGVSIAITTKADGDSSDLDKLLENSILKIYNDDKELIRRYSPATECPETMYLVVGDYSYTLTIGSMESPTLDNDKLSYSAVGDFTVTSTESTPIVIDCTLQNSKFGVEFDDSDKGLNDNLEEGYYISFAIVDGDVEASKVDEEMFKDTTLEKLTFTEDGAGYFIVPEGKKVAWFFKGTRIDLEKVVRGGVLAVDDCTAGKSNTLKISYDKYLDLDGLKVMVDKTTEDKEDIFDFFPQPKVEASNFTIGDAQKIDGTKDFTFDISSLSDMDHITVMVGDEDITKYATHSVTNVNNWVVTLDSQFAEHIGSSVEQSVVVTAYDVNNSAGSATMKVNATGITGIIGEDFWANTGVISAKVYEAGATDVKIKIKDTDSTTWSEFDATAGSDNTFTANVTLADVWTETKSPGNNVCYLLSSNGIAPNRSYDCQVVVDGVARPAVTVTSGGTTQAIPNGNIESGLSCFTNSNKETTSWGSGNNSNTPSLCSFGNIGGSACAKLTTDAVFGIKAAGNLFYGTFEFKSLTGYVSFGQSFSWTARPKTLKVKYAASFKDDDITAPDGSTFDNDRARIYMAIVDWDTQHVVSAGTGATSGSWDPEKDMKLDEGKIIAYASRYIDSSTSTSELIQLELPIYYYDKEAKPSKTYTLVISCASSAYGDYKIGVEGSTLYVDDFEFGY